MLNTDSCENYTSIIIERLRHKQLRVRNREKSSYGIISSRLAKNNS